MFFRHSLCDSGFSIGGDEGGGVAVAEALRPEELGVASAAVDLLVGAVTRQHRVQRPVAFRAIEAFLVPHLFMIS